MSQFTGAEIAIQLVHPGRCRVIYSINKAGQSIGEIELDQIAWRSGEAELKIEITDQKMHGQGFGTQAINALLEQAFSRMNLKRVYLRVFAENTAALRCYEKVGFTKEGRLQRRMNGNSRQEIILMGIKRTEFLNGSAKKPETA